MYKQWPLGQLPSELQRPELNQLKDRGYSFGNPTEVVDIFEKKSLIFVGLSLWLLLIVVVMQFF